eukprot:3022315-Amphidinium_carterae.1
MSQATTPQLPQVRVRDEEAAAAQPTSAKPGADSAEVPFAPTEPPDSRPESQLPSLPTDPMVVDQQQQHQPVTPTVAESELQRLAALASDSMAVDDQDEPVAPPAKKKAKTTPK